MNTKSKKNSGSNEVKCGKCGYVGVPIDKMFGVVLCSGCNRIISSNYPPYVKEVSNG